MQILRCFRDLDPALLPPQWKEDNDLQWWKYITLDDAGKVPVSLKFPSSQGTGWACRIYLEALPSTLTCIDLGVNNMCHGELSQQNGEISLPPNLVTLELQSHPDAAGFTGTIDFATLPRTLRSINLLHNKFSRIANLNKAPPQLEVLRLSWNPTLSGNVFDFRALATACPALEELYIANCGFAGDTAGIAHLPACLSILDISNNSFSGHPPAGKKSMWNVENYDGKSSGKCVLQ